MPGRPVRWQRHRGLAPRLALLAAVLGAATPAPGAVERFLCSEPRGDGQPPVEYHFTLHEGGWFRSPSLVWDDKDLRLEITALSPETIKGEVASADHMPLPEEIDRCIDEALSGPFSFDRKAVSDRCRQHAPLSKEPVLIKLQIVINPQSGRLIVTRAQSKRIQRYNIDSAGSCRRVSAAGS